MEKIKQMVNFEPIPVLNGGGYVKLLDYMGDELRIVNAARASFAKESFEFDEKDEKLLKFLLREKHLSPLRHVFFSFELKAPLMVCRQIFKYSVGADHTMLAWNEASYRYITIPQTFYIPKENEWRGKPENKKQGSAEPVSTEIGKTFTTALEEMVKHGENLYNLALEAGICAEQARLLLPAYGMYVNWRWSCSAACIVHFLSERLAHDAQKETQLYAQAIKELVYPVIPLVIDSMVLKKDIR